MEQLFDESWATRRRPFGVPLGFVLADRYELRSLLGGGGEADVFLAEDRVLGREVAVKLFRQDRVPADRSGLREVEARVGAALSHYALATLFDSGRARGPEGEVQLFLVMEYIRGQSLAARLQSGPLEPSEALWLGFDIAEGLDHMHRTGFLHRDVKPGNILISSARSARPVVAKLTDFGIAVPVDVPDLSEFTIGTAAYLSPERVEGEDARPESDVYSLGLVLLQAITGRAEFRGSVEEAAFARLSRDPRIPEEIPPRTAALLRRMTARRPEDRIGLHDAALEMQQILVDDLVRRRGQQIEATPPESSGADFRAIAAQNPDGLARALRLARVAADAPAAAILLWSSSGVELVAHDGWAAPPTELAGTLAPNDPSPRRMRRSGGERLGDERMSALLSVSIRRGEERSLGALVVADVRDRDFSTTQREAVEDVAALVAQDLHLRGAVRRALFPEA
ncbi:serine/threonine-protein kinase [Amnibacterium kyonggiense]